MAPTKKDPAPAEEPAKEAATSAATEAPAAPVECKLEDSEVIGTKRCWHPPKGG